MSKRLTDNELLKLVHDIKAKQAALPVIPKSDVTWQIFQQARDAHHAAAADLVQDLVKDHGARLTHPLGGHRLSMAGISTTCTGGEAGVITNWINAAYRELDRRRAS